MFNLFIRTGLGAVAALAATVSASPALANASANADISAPLRAAQSEKPTALGSRDEQFKALFSRWQSLETGSLPTTSAVSIPARAPLDSLRMTSNFGLRWHPVTGGRRQHEGVDLASPVGTPIHATADGTVAKADWFGGYGLFVQLEHGGALQTRYGHMSRLNVAAGQHVHKGDIIGYVGTTGRSTGPHLHYEVRVNGQPVNPIPYMQAGDAVQLAVADTTGAQGGPDE
jgi:murein DD-endopeptidase MepM/ murein hydrolase activator NlpD